MTQDQKSVEDAQLNDKLSRNKLPNNAQDSSAASSVSKPKSKLLSWGWSALKYLILFAVIYTAINWWRQPVMPADPQLQLTDYQGQMVDIEALSHESPVLVYFWGTWCPICSTTSPKVNSLSESGNYPVVSIAVQSGSNQDIEQFMTEHSYSFTTINDEAGKIFSDWEGQVTPSYVVLKDGEMQQGLTGIQPEWSLRLRLWLSSLF